MIKPIAICITILALAIAAPTAVAAPAGKGKVDCDNPASWPKGREKQFEKICARQVERAQKNEAAVREREAWIAEHGRGDDMRATFAANNNIIPREKDLGSQIVWTYWSKKSGALFAECEEYVFDKQGNLDNRRVYECE